MQKLEKTTSIRLITSITNTPNTDFTSVLSSFFSIIDGQLSLADKNEET